MITGIELAMRAVRPWQSIEAQAAVIHIQTDAQARIDKCLNCTLPDCTNCYEQKDRAMQGQFSLFGDMAE